MQEDSGLHVLARLSEIDVSTEGVKGAKNFFEAKVRSQGLRVVQLCNGTAQTGHWLSPSLSQLSQLFVGCAGLGAFKEGDSKHCSLDTLPCHPYPGGSRAGVGVGGSSDLIHLYVQHMHRWGDTLGPMTPESCPPRPPTFP